MRHTCPHCQRLVSLDAPTSGEQFACPHCTRGFVYYDPAGEPPRAQRMVHERASTHEGPLVDRAVQAGYPPADGPEVDVLVVRPSPARARPLEFFGFGTLALVGLGAGLFGWGNQWHNVAWAACLAGGLTAGLMPTWMKVRSLSAQVRVTNRRVIDRDGFFQRRVSEVLHRDIRNVRVDQTLRERIWRVGSIAIYTGGEEEPEVAIRDVPNPQRVRDVIDLYRPL